MICIPQAWGPGPLSQCYFVVSYLHLHLHASLPGLSSPTQDVPLAALALKFVTKLKSPRVEFFMELYRIDRLKVCRGTRRDGPFVWQIQTNPYGNIIIIITVHRTRARTHMHACGITVT